MALLVFMNLFAVIMGHSVSLMPAVACMQVNSQEQTDATATSQSEDWSEFQNRGISSSAAISLPVEWDPETPCWTAEIIGYGQSSPVSYDDLVYVTSVIGDNKEEVHIQAIQIDDGQTKWDFRRPNSSPEENTVMVSRAAPTPVVDSNGVYAFFEGGNLLAVDHQGKLRWERDLRTEFGPLKARHGLAASLEHDQEAIYLWAERMESPYVMKIEKETGKTIWKQPGLGTTSWSSPRLIQVGDSQHLVISGIGRIAGLDPIDGRILWELTDVTGNSSSTPIAVGDSKFLIGSIGAVREGKKYPSCGVVSIQKNSDDTFVAEWVWNTDKATCSFGSPVVADERVYFVNKTGIVFCHQLSDGELLYKERIPIDQIWATPLVNGSNIYFFGKNGVTVVIEASDFLKQKAENQLWEKEGKPAADSNDPAQRFAGSVLYAAAIAKGKLLLRRGDRLYALESRPDAEAKPATQ